MLLPWITIGLCITAFLGAVPVSAVLHRHRVLGSEDFGHPVHESSRAREVGGSNDTGAGAFDYVSGVQVERHQA